MFVLVAFFFFCVCVVVVLVVATQTNYMHVKKDTRSNRRAAGRKQWKRSYRKRQHLCAFLAREQCFPSLLLCLSAFQQRTCARVCVFVCMKPPAKG